MFDKICFALSTLRVVFTPSVSTIVDKKKRNTNIFLKTTLMRNFRVNGIFNISHALVINQHSSLRVFLLLNRIDLVKFSLNLIYIS